MDKSTLNKVQHQFWVTKQTVYRKLGKKEDECIVASDASLDAKLELFKSIQQTSSSINKLLDRYQEKICFLAQEQNAMGRFLKEYGKTDKTNAGKMMIQMGKSLIYCSQQEIALRPPLLRLYQEVDTFRNRAVEDTLETINNMERNRTEYRASLNWMKNVSQELDPDTYKQMEKFRKVQTHVKRSKTQFDKLKLACLQKVDLLAAARCNMFSHALIQYQNATIKTTGKNARIFNTLASTFKGYHHYEFSVVKELAEPSRRLQAESGTQGIAEEMLFDFNDDLASAKGRETKKEVKEEIQTDNLLGIENSSGERDTAEADNSKPPENVEDLLASAASASELLENLLGGAFGTDVSPETEQAKDALDLDLGLFSPLPTSSASDGKDKENNPASTFPSLSMNASSAKDQKKNKDKDIDLLVGDLEGFSLENDTMTLLNEILSVCPQPPLAMQTQQPLIPLNEGDGPSPSAAASAKPNATNLAGPSSFLPSHLLDFGNLEDSGDLLNFNGPATGSILTPGKQDEQPGGQTKSWYDIFADLDPIANPDAVGKKQTEEIDNRYC